jgi:Predicted transcriptional regulator
MMEKQGVYLGPRLRRLRRDLGLTQAVMATDLDISPSYIALMERNQRPVTAEILLKLAKAYKVDFSSFGNSSGPDLVARLQASFKDPILSDIDLTPLDIADIAHSFPGFGEAVLRLHTAYVEGQFALADYRGGSTGKDSRSLDPIAPVRSFLAARRNYFPTLDSCSEKLSERTNEAGSLEAYLKERHGLRVRRLPSHVMVGSLRRLDWHRRELLLDETLRVSSQRFHVAQQLAYLEFEREIETVLSEGTFSNESTRRLAHRALSAYCAAAVLMPYAAFARAVESKRYDVEALARQFNTSFEQTAHRLTTLQRPGLDRVPFFFIRVDPAGNVSKRLDGGNFPFAKHGGGCPLWSVHQVFETPGKTVTQWLELPEGQRYFSISRTVVAGGGSFLTPTIPRAVALVCEGHHADRLVYNDERSQRDVPTPIGISCRICHRSSCTARAEPPIGRQLLPDNYRRPEAPFGFSDT